jgi:uncharacterized membrane protein
MVTVAFGHRKIFLVMAPASSPASAVVVGGYTHRLRRRETTFCRSERAALKLQPRSLAVFVAILLILRFVLRLRVSIVGSLALTLVVALIIGELSRRRGD